MLGRIAGVPPYLHHAEKGPGRRFGRGALNTDAHLIGLDVTQLLVKRNAHAKKERSVKPAKPAAESTVGRDQNGGESD
jgi:hypothetical protein